MIVVLFILLVSSLVGIITSQHIKTTAQLSSMWESYYTAYYRAYGGVEMAFAQLAHHGFGYASHSSLPVDCDSCDVEVEIKWRSHVIPRSFTGTSCSMEHAWPLAVGDGLVIPMFWDEAEMFTPPRYTSLSVSELVAATPRLESVGPAGSRVVVRIVDTDGLYYASQRSWPVWTPVMLAEQMQWSLPGDSIQNQKFLVITSEWAPLGVCLYTQTPFPAPVIPISSVGRAGATEVTLSATRSMEIPSFLLFGIIER